MGVTTEIVCNSLIQVASLIMIDISQWRATIGLWYGHWMLYTIETKTTSSIMLWVESLWSGGFGDKGGGNLISLVLFLFLLLILSGDVELNPVPKTGI